MADAQSICRGDKVHGPSGWDYITPLSRVPQPSEEKKWVVALKEKRVAFNKTKWVVALKEKWVALKKKKPRWWVATIAISLLVFAIVIVLWAAVYALVVAVMWAFEKGPFSACNPAPNHPCEFAVKGGQMVNAALLVLILVEVMITIRDQIPEMRRGPDELTTPRLIRNIFGIGILSSIRHTLVIGVELALPEHTSNSNGVSSSSSLLWQLGINGLLVLLLLAGFIAASAEVRKEQHLHVP